MVKAIFFDVANTLLHKPSVFGMIKQVLEENGYQVDLKTLEVRHKLLSEVINFPDKTNGEFYNVFNKELLYTLGIPPSENLIREIYNRCSYLPWEAFPDSKMINDLTFPLGIISNWDNTLKQKLKGFFSVEFNWVLGSQSMEMRKPSIDFYSKIIEITSLPPQDILYIGDSIKLDIEPTLSLGMNAVLIDRIGIYTSQATPVIRDMNEIYKFL